MDGNLQMRATFTNHEKIRSSSFGSVSTKSQKATGDHPGVLRPLFPRKLALHKEDICALAALALG